MSKLSRDPLQELQGLLPLKDRILESLASEREAQPRNEAAIRALEWWLSDLQDRIKQLNNLPNFLLPIPAPKDDGTNAGIPA